MGVQIKVHDKELNRALEKATATGLTVATQHYQTQLKLVVNSPNTGERGRGKGGRYKKTTYPNPSQPGQPPKKRTGFGQRGIVREVDRKNLIARVGVTAAAIYMAFLELGTRWIARRPWLITTLHRNKRTMAKLFSASGRRLK